MAEDSAPKRATRSDAVRNRELTFAAAKNCFADHGATASMEDIAKRAGVGVGTLYRAFGSRAGLAEAVFRDMLDDLAKVATELATERDPWDALVAWLKAFVSQLRSKQTMISELQPLFDQNPRFLHESRQSAARDLMTVLAPAQVAGLVREDLSALELMHLVNGIASGPFAVERVDSLLEILLDGIRVISGVVDRGELRKMHAPKGGV